MPHATQGGQKIKKIKVESLKKKDVEITIVNLNEKTLEGVM